MRTCQEALALSEPHGEEAVDLFTLSYMSGLARDRIHQVILEALEQSGLTRSQLARRLGMDKSQLSKILNTSSNIRAETLGALLFAIDGSCPHVTRNWPLREARQNMREPAWFGDCLDQARAINTHNLAIFDKVASVSTTNPATFSAKSSVETKEYA